MSDIDLKKDFQERYRYAHDYWAPFQEAARIYTLASAGRTWSDTELKMLAKQKREPMELNIMRRPQQFFSGYLRDNINEIVYKPVEGSDQKTADQFTKLGYYIWDKGQGFPVFLDAADEMLKSGMSLVGLQMDYSKDFIDGDISFFKRTYNSFYLDPLFEKIDLTDCAYAITRDLVSKDLAKQLIPQVDPSVIEDLAAGFKDDKFLQFHPNFTTFVNSKRMVAYDQYYQRITKSRKMLVDLDNGFSRDITDLQKEDMDRLKFGLKRLSDAKAEERETGDRSGIPNVEIRTVQRGFVELHIMLNGIPIWTGEDQTGINTTFPFVPMLCYFEPSIWFPSLRVQGLSSCNYYNQRQFIKRHMKIVDMFDSEISKGYKYLLGSVPDPSELEQSGQGPIIGVDPDNAPQGLDSVQQLTGSGANPVLIEYAKVLDELSLTLANVNESALGTDEGGNAQISGRLAEVRIAQGLRGNRKIFDNVETSQQLLGGLVLKCVQAKYSPGKVERIIAEEPTEQFYNDEFEQYDAVITEGVRSKSQKDAYYYELVNLTKDGVVDVPQSEIVRALSMSGMSELQEAIDKQEEQKAEQQQKIDQQEQMALELANAQKEQMLALAQERRARVVADISLAAERSSEAEENRAQAALARAKTITEISEMETGKVLQVLDFVNTLELQEAADREAIDQKIQAQANQINSETQGSAENQQLNASLQPQEAQPNPIGE